MEHFDENAEASVIAAICATEHATSVFRELTEDDFYVHECRRQFVWLQRAFNSGTIREAIRQVMEKGLKPIAEHVPLYDAMNAIRNHSMRRKIANAVMELHQMNGDYSIGPSDIQESFKELAVRVMDSRACKTPSSTAEDIEKYRAETKNSTKAFVTGIPAIDQEARIQPTDFVVLAARPSVGKSALATSFVNANFLGPDRHEGIVISIEMDLRQTYSRSVSQLSGVALQKFFNPQRFPLTPEDEVNIAMAEERILSEYPKRWFLQGTVTLSDIERVVEIERPEWILIDYAQIISHDSKFGKVDKLDEISTGLRQMALEKGVAVIIVAQLNRKADGEAPKISHIKGSGQFEQDATHIFLLDRPESEKNETPAKRNYYSRDGQLVELETKHGTTNLAALLVGKNRNGPKFYELLRFNPRTTEFTEYE